MANTVGVNEVAQFCNISPRRVQQLVKEGLPQVGRGKYLLAAAAQWYIVYLQKQLKEQGSGTSNKEVKDRRSRYLEIQAATAELDYRRKVGDLVDREQAGLVINEAMVIIASQMDGLGGRLAGELAGIMEPALIRQTLLNETRRIRAAAADRLSRLAVVESGGRNSKATTRKRARSVGGSKQNTAGGKRGTGAVAKRKKPVHDTRDQGDT